HASAAARRPFRRAPPPRRRARSAAPGAAGRDDAPRASSHAAPSARRWSRNAPRRAGRWTRRTDCRPEWPNWTLPASCSNCTRQRPIPPSAYGRRPGNVRSLGRTTGMKVQVCIIGGGPSGLLLSQLLHLRGIDTIVLEKYSRDHVLARIRAGVLEHGFARLMREAQCGERMDREGEIHNGFEITHDGVLSHIDLHK